MCQLAEDDTPIDALTPAQQALLSSPQTLLYALQFGLILSKALEQKWGERYLQYVELMVSETRIYLRGHQDPDLLEALASACHIDVDEPELNIDFAYQLFSILRAYRFTLPPQALRELEQRQNKTLAESEDQPQDLDSHLAGINQFLNEMIRQEQITSGHHFVSVAANELAMFPEQGIEAIFGQLLTYPWAIEALLICTLHHEPAVSNAAISVLNHVPPKKWKQLTNSQYLMLIRRFGGDTVQKHLSAWQKQAMKHVKASVPGRVESLHACFIDGNQAMMFSGTLKLGNQHHQFGGVFRLGLGLIDAYFHADLDPNQIDQLTQRLRSEMRAIPCDPLLLAHLLPWALHTQLHGPEPLGLDALPMLAHLPHHWLEPQAMTLDRIRDVCQLQPLSTDELERFRKGSKMLLNTPHTIDWVVDEIAPGLNKQKQVRDHHYLAQPQQYIDSLGMNALIAHFAGEKATLTHLQPQWYLGAAYVLQLGEIGRKSFPLFDHLAEHSLEWQRQATFADKLQGDISAPKGYVIKVELLDSKPKIWRRFTVSGAVHMASFHSLLQRVMGWEHAHLFAFQTSQGMLDEDVALDEIPLMALLNEPGDSIGYLYDFGDHWQHAITLEKIQSKDCRTPKVTAGRGACPPEDCGGIWGYQNLLALRRRKRLNEDEEEQLEWYGMDGDFDPAAFDKTQVEL
ncbi:plasmid pRiA4b ORF-3 family protein [Ferrimonas pelagia]|uniref:plasmid pRiA4b ORF-3 family protein n=1 Tax=Ferrimonas pelagia TaxID=1177826 RepID=UPI0031E56807